MENRKQRGVRITGIIAGRVPCARACRTGALFLSQIISVYSHTVVCDPASEPPPARLPPRKFTGFPTDRRVSLPCRSARYSPSLHQWTLGIPSINVIASHLKRAECAEIPLAYFLVSPILLLTPPLIHSRRRRCTGHLPAINCRSPT